MELLHECMMKVKEEEEKIHELIIMLFFLHYITAYICKVYKIF